MSKYVDDLKRKREDENKSSSLTNTKKSSSSISTSSSSRIEQLRAERYIYYFIYFNQLYIFFF